MVAIELATGQQLASRLAKLVPSLLSGSVPACLGRRLSAAVDLLERQQARHDALMAAVAILDPTGTLSTYGKARRLQAAILRLERGLRRIERGARPATELEQNLIVIRQSGAVGWRRLWSELRDLQRH